MEEVEMGSKSQSDPSCHHLTGRPKDSGRPSKVHEQIQHGINASMTEMMWQAGAQSAKKAWNVYGNIDLLRPYFDVEPWQVRERLLRSFLPLNHGGQTMTVPSELYGPLMVVLTMIALLHYQMKSANHKVADGTLIGSAIGLCFAYWLGMAASVRFMSHFSAIRLSMIQSLNMVGYGMFSHCVILLLGTVSHVSQNRALLHFLSVVVCGLAVLRMGAITMSRSSCKRSAAFVTCVLALFHLLFIFYLNIAYRAMLEELSEIFDHPLNPHPQNVPADDVAASA